MNMIIVDEAEGIDEEVLKKVAHPKVGKKGKLIMISTDNET